MGKSIMDLVAEAKSVVPDIGPDEVAAMKHQDDVLIVDVRDDDEVAQTGVVDGALHVTRGMLEFRADETTPYHNEAFSKENRSFFTAPRGADRPSPARPCWSLVIRTFAILARSRAGLMPAAPSESRNRRIGIMPR